MLVHIPSAFDFSRWDGWVVLVTGLAFASLTLLLGRTLLVGRRSGRRLPAENDGASRDPFVLGSTMERRSSLRRRDTLVRVMVSDAEAAAQPVEGWVLDRSTTGLCLATDQEFASGRIVSTRACAAPATVPWVQLEVKYSRTQNGGWEHGCAFVKPPPWGVLLYFG